MLTKIKNFLIAFGIAAMVICAAYFAGKRKGRQDEKIKNTEAVRKNIAAAMRARSMLGDSDFIRRLREKYSRK
jgi:hypothetical protein